MSMQQLFSARMTDGSSSSFDWAGGEGLMVVTGTTNGATTTLEMSPDGGTTWIATEAVLADTTGTDHFRLPACKVRATISNDGASTSLSVWIGKILMK